MRRLLQAVGLFTILLLSFALVVPELESQKDAKKKFKAASKSITEAIRPLSHAARTKRARAHEQTHKVSSSAEVYFTDFEGPDGEWTAINAGSGTGIPTIDAAQADERYPITARDGASLGVNYEVTIGARGTVTMIMQGPDGVLWQHTFTASETGRAEVQIEQGGTYEVLVFRENLDGSYAVSWD